MVRGTMSRTILQILKAGLAAGRNLNPVLKRNAKRGVLGVGSRELTRDGVSGILIRLLRLVMCRSGLFISANSAALHNRNLCFVLIDDTHPLSMNLILGMGLVTAFLAILDHLTILGLG